MSGEHRIDLPPGLPMLSSNQRIHYMERYRRNRLFKDSAYLQAKLMRVPTVLHADVTAIIHPGPRTRLFDPHNYMPSVKGAIDGLVLAGVLPKDDSRYLRRVTIEAGPRSAQGWQVTLILRPLLEVPATPPPLPARPPRSPREATA